MKNKEKKINDATGNGSAAVGVKAARRPFPIVKVLIAVALILVLFYFGFTCEVREGECAVILQFGAVRDEITEAGLYLKLPWPFETVVKYDNRMQIFEGNFLDVLTKDQKLVTVQSYVVWSISDPVLYHNSVGKQGAISTSINSQIFNATNGVMGMYNLDDLVSLSDDVKTEEIQNEIHNRVYSHCLANYGIEIKETSYLRLSFPNTTLQDVFAQMSADRQKEIDTIISKAQTEAGKIRNDADIEAEQIIASGTQEAASIKAKTEKEVAKIYTEAQKENLELYQFLKSLDTIIASVGESTVLVVKADEYPFNVLTEYGDYITDENDEAIIQDLSYILARLPEEDRAALITAIGQLIESAAQGAEVTQ